MSQAVTSSAVDGLWESLIRCLDAESARRLLEFRISDSIQQRVNVLAERANEGILTPNEQSEYDAVINASNLITILKLKAQRALESNNPR
jgi:hypothetical protein